MSPQGAELCARARIPHFHETVFAGRRDLETIGAKANRLRGSTVGFPELEQVLPGRRFPNPNALVEARGGETLAVGTESDRREVMAVRFECPHEFAGGRIPKMDQSVEILTRDENLTVGTPGDRTDHLAFLRSQCFQNRAGLSVPDQNGPLD